MNGFPAAEVAEIGVVCGHHGGGGGVPGAPVPPTTTSPPGEEPVPIGVVPDPPLQATTIRAKTTVVMILRRGLLESGAEYRRCRGE